MHIIRRAVEADIPGMVAMAEAKRIEYQGYSPVFWRKAPDASSRHEHYLQSLLRSLRASSETHTSQPLLSP